MCLHVQQCLDVGEGAGGEYTNWSCHSHVASVRARVAVPVAVSWAGQLSPPKILRIRSLVRQLGNQCPRQSTVRPSLPPSWSLLFASRLCSTLVYPADTNISLCIFVYLYLYMIYFIWHLLFTLMRKSKALYANTHTHWNMPSICWEMYLLCGAYLR